MKLMIIFGTRPEIIKLAPVILLAKTIPQFSAITCSTGQHKEMLDQGLKVFDIQPDIDLNVMTHNQNLENLTSVLMNSLSIAIKENKPDVVMVQGDTTTAFVGALAAFYQKIPVAHVEAGLRTGDLNSPFPEELNRSMIARIATWHFAPTNNSKDNLLKEGIDPHKIFITGNTIVDSIELLAGTKEAQEYLKNRTSVFPTKDFILVTAHRRENHGSGIDSICNAIKDLAKEHPDLEFIFPVHLNPKVRESVHVAFKGNKQIKLIDPVDFPTLLFLESKARLVISDSGGIQEEAPSFLTPVVVTREHTERSEGINIGFAKLAGSNSQSIVRCVNQYLNNANIRFELSSRNNPYGDGKAAERIIQIIQAQQFKEYEG